MAEIKPKRVRVAKPKPPKAVKKITLKAVDLKDAQKLAGILRGSVLYNTNIKKSDELTTDMVVANSLVKRIKKS